MDEQQNGIDIQCPWLVSGENVDMWKHMKERVYQMRGFLRILLGVLGFSWIAFPIIDVQSQQPSTSVDSPVVREIDWRPDEGQIAIADQAGRIQIVDVLTGQTLLTWQSDASGATTSVAWSPDGSMLASGGADAEARIWDATTGQLISSQRHTTVLTAVAWNSDGSKLASFDYGGQVSVWEPTTGNILLSISSSYIQHGDWSPDSTKLAVGAGTGIEFWDANTGTFLGGVSGHNGEVQFVDWGSNDHIASASLDGTVRIWDAATGQLLQTLTGHTAGVEGVRTAVWSPDSTRIASAGGDGSVRIWDVATGQALQIVQTNSGISSVTFSPYGGRLAYSNFTPSSSPRTLAGEAVTAQTLVGGIISIFVPAPTSEELRAITEACNALTAVEQALPTAETASQLSAFISRVEALPEDTIPSACAADLIAVAEALQNQ
jgi:hypothetical protein